MRLRDTLIAWSPATSRVRVGLVPEPGGIDWTTWPAAYARKRRGADAADILSLVAEIIADAVPSAAVHRAFLLLDEYVSLSDGE